MLQTARITDALPVLARPVPTCEDELPEYWPSLLLDLNMLDSRIVKHGCFYDACNFGFTSYFTDMFTDDGESYTHRFYTLDEVLDDLTKNMMDAFGLGCDCDFVGCMGVAWGRLSALALYQSDLATAARPHLLSLMRVSISYQLSDCSPSCPEPVPPMVVPAADSISVVPASAFGRPCGSDGLSVGM